MSYTDEQSYMDRHDPNWDFLAHSSQRGQSYSFTPSNGYNNHPPSDIDDRTATPPPREPVLSMAEELTNFADAIANNFKLDPENRADLHSFLELGSDLSFAPLKIAVVQHATALQTQQMVREALTMCGTIQKVVKSIEEKYAASFTPDQTFEMRSACRFVVFDHTRVNFDNDTIIKAATAHLKKYKNTNGFKDVFSASSKGREKALVKAIRDQASYAKSVVRHAILASMPGNNNGTKKTATPDGTGLTALVTTLAKKCTGLSENATTQEAIWCAILRHMVRETPRLAKLGDSDEPQEVPRPPKRNRDGVAKSGTAAEGNDFFSIIEGEFLKLQKDMGNDWKSPEWVEFIDRIIGRERRLWPSDPLPLIPQTQGLPRAQPSSSGSSRATGLAGVYTPAHTRARASDARPLQSSSARGSHNRSVSVSHRTGSDSLAGPSGVSYHDDRAHPPPSGGVPRLPPMSDALGAAHQTHSRHASIDERPFRLPPIQASTSDP
ncbi:hypothetical protein B0H11DRAFT_2129370 [Mycena galericulata]|nr:hypothetical protein B0H11DRAFT_2129370 [Mycena galericulata]